MRGTLCVGRWFSGRLNPGLRIHPFYGEPAIGELRFLWAVQGTPCGRLLAAVLPDLVPRLGRLKDDRAKLDPRGRSHTKPGSLLKDSITIRTWSESDDARPGFVEIDLVGHDSDNAFGASRFPAGARNAALARSRCQLVIS